MRAFVLAAGYGKRLEPLTKAVPKPMVPVANKPIIQYNLELLRKYGIKDLMVNIHYFPEQIENYFGDGSQYGVSLNYSYEEHLMGTAGGVLKMFEQSKVKDTFIVMSSDVLSDINLGKMLNMHKKKKAKATIALTPVNDVSQFGVVVVDENDKITAFQEKPSQAEAKSNLVNAGIYIFEPEVLDLIPKNLPYDFGHNVFPQLVKEKAAFYGYKMIEYWNDIGGPEKLMQANADILQGRVRVDISARRVGRSEWVGKNTHVDPSARFNGEIIIGDNSIIEKNVEIYGNVSIGDKCVIKEGTIITDSFIWADTHVEKSCRLNQCIVGNWCFLEENVRVEEGSIIANRSRIKQGQTVRAGSKIEPDRTV
jgi:NDP-sugar pyrophosphorylase family protein